jgi:hypothetical protein
MSTILPFGTAHARQDAAASAKRMGTGPAGQRRAARVISLVLLAAACAPARLPPPSPVPGGAPVQGFTLEPDSQPVVSSGRAGWPILPSDPNIYVDAEGYHLFYSTLFCRRDGGYVYAWDPAHPHDCDINKVVTAIAYAFSRDHGLTWTFRQSPVLQPPDSGFDSYRIETAYAFRIGDVLYIAYSGDGDLNGHPFRGRYQIGLARLVLGQQSVRAALMDESRQFERRPTPWLPFDLGQAGSDNNVQEPSVTMGPDGLVLYYIGLGLRLPNEPTGAPGQHIDRVELRRALLDDQLHVISRSDAGVPGGVNTPEVRYFDGAYHLFGTTLISRTQQGQDIIYATSPDGVRWSTPRIILSPGGVPGFTDWGLNAPTAAVDTGHVVLFLTAIGSESRACFPVPPEGRWGVPWGGGNDKCIFLSVARAVAPRPLDRSNAGVSRHP